MSHYGKLMQPVLKGQKTLVDAMVENYQAFYIKLKLGLFKGICKFICHWLIYAVCSWCMLQGSDS